MTIREELDAVRSMRRGLKVATRLLELGDEKSRKAASDLIVALLGPPGRSDEADEVAERIEGMGSWEAFNEVMQALAAGELTMEEAEELTEELGQ